MSGLYQGNKTCTGSLERTSAARSCWPAAASIGTLICERSHVLGTPASCCKVAHSQPVYLKALRRTEISAPPLCDCNARSSLSKEAVCEDMWSALVHACMQSLRCLTAYMRLGVREALRLPVTSKVTLGRGPEVPNGLRPQRRFS